MSSRSILHVFRSFFDLQSSPLNRGVFSLRRILLIVFALEMLTFWVVLTGNKLYVVGYVALLTVPLFLILLPAEPTLGILAMFAATGFDFLGRILETRLAIKFDLTYFHVALVLTFIAVILHMILKRSLTFPSLDLWAPLLLFNISVGFSLIYTPAFTTGSWMFVRILVMGVVAWMMVQIVDREWQVKVILWTMLLIPFGISVLSIYQLFNQGSFYSAVVYRAATALGMNIYRSTGTFVNPNTLACFLMIGAVVPFGLMFSKKYSIPIKTFLMFTLFVTTAGIITTFSRTGWLSTLAALTVVIALNRKWSYFGMITVLVAFAVVVVAIKRPEMIEAVAYRFTSIFNPSADDSSSSRLSLIRSGIWMWQEHPIFGIGIEGFSSLYDNFVDPNMPDILVNVKDPHTVQSEILTELGIVGFVIATWLYFTILFHGIRTSLSMERDILRNAQITFTALHVGFLVNFTFATDIVNNAFWMNVGLIYAIPFIEQYTSTRNVEIAAEGRYLESTSPG